MNNLSLFTKQFKSSQNIILLLALITILSFGLIYIPNETAKNYCRWGINLALLVVSISIITCNLTRLKTRRRLLKTGNNGREVRYREQGDLPLDRQRAVLEIADTLQRNRFVVQVSGNAIRAEKNRHGIMGSIAFHLGLVLVVTGFLVNSFLGFRGTVFIPEGVLVKLPEDVRVTESGLLLKSPPSYYAALDNLTYKRIGPDVDFNAESVAEIYFTDELRETRQQMKINYPASFNGVYWHYLDSGYSVFLKISSSTGILVEDYANIESHGVRAWHDTVPVNDDLKLQISFYPDYFLEKEEHISKSMFPENPAIELTILQGSEKLGPSLVKMGQVLRMGDLTVEFPKFRQWQVFDISSDPGRMLIRLGSLISVIGLIWRITFITSCIACRVEVLDSGSRVHWMEKSNYRNITPSGQMKAIMDRLEADNL